MHSYKSELWEPQSAVSKLTITETSYGDVLLLQFAPIDKDPEKKQYHLITTDFFHDFLHPQKIDT